MLLLLYEKRGRSQASVLMKWKGKLHLLGQEVREGGFEFELLGWLLLWQTFLLHHSPPPLPYSLLVSPLFSSSLLSPYLPSSPLTSPLLHPLLSLSFLSLLGPKVPKKPRLATHSSFLESESEDDERTHRNGVIKRCINDCCVFCSTLYCLSWNYSIEQSLKHSISAIWIAKTNFPVSESSQKW